MKKEKNFGRNQIIVKWDPHNIPIVSEVSGKVRYEDVIEGETLRIEVDTKTGFERKIITEHKGDHSPQIGILDDDDNPIAFYQIPEKAILRIEENQKIKEGTILALTPKQGAKTKDITGGLPRITELFEARQPKEPGIMAELSGAIEFGDPVRGKKVVFVKAPSGVELDHKIPPGKSIVVSKGDIVRAGDAIVEGPLVPEDILRINGEEALQNYLLDEIQSVYRAQGQSIDDKHIEIIISQMMRKVTIQNIGDTLFLPESLVDKMQFRAENNRVIEAGGRPATARPVLLGITKASLQSGSFISAASFQETTKVLTEAALAGRVDPLVGLKENVILGHLIPAGTGFSEHFNSVVKCNIEEVVADDDADEEEIEAEIGEISEMAAEVKTEEQTNTEGQTNTETSEEIG